jgi:hypothetical protein
VTAWDIQIYAIENVYRNLSIPLRTSILYYSCFFSPSTECIYKHAPPTLFLFASHFAEDALIANGMLHTRPTIRSRSKDMVSLSYRRAVCAYSCCRDCVQDEHCDLRRKLCLHMNDSKKMYGVYAEEKRDVPSHKKIRTNNNNNINKLNHE